MRKAYTVAQQSEAIALSRVMGIEGAAEQLGIDRRTVRKWATAAGIQPEIPGDALEGLYALAIAQTTAAVASGKLPIIKVMTIAGIAARNLRAKPAPPLVDPESDDPEPLTTAARQRFTDWIAALPDADRRTVKRAIRLELARRSKAGEQALTNGTVVPTGRAWESDAEEAANWDAIRHGMAADLPALAAHVAAADAIDAARQDQYAKAARWLPDDEADLLIEAEKYLETIA